MAATTATARRMVGKVSPETTALMVCDIQERFSPLVQYGKTVIGTAQYMTSIAQVLEMPIVVTQQYTKVFGPTCPDVFKDKDLLASGTIPTFEKKLFSMMTPEVKKYLQPLNRTSYILLGLEAHVCVQQTALDLLEEGNDVHIVVDGVSSQQAFDREIALQRLSQAGAYLTTAQSLAFMLMKSAEGPNFKQISKLTVEHMKKDPNEFNEKATTK